MALRTISEAEQRRKQAALDHPAQCLTPMLPRKLIVLEGRLELERIPFYPPAECQHNCDLHLTPWLCGLARANNSATNIAVIEMCLESLNGKYVRITIEAEA